MPAPTTQQRPLGELASSLGREVGTPNVITDASMIASYSTDWTRRFGGPAALVVRPGSTSEVAAVIDRCREARVPVVVQGGNTGLVGGSVPPPGGSGTPPVVLSTTRLRDIGPVDATAYQLTAGAGATLARVQSAARAAGLELPVDLAARDSATVGGMVATNAGGVHVLRYGSMRRQVIGLEAVLGDGSVITRLGGLVKDNTGYDLSQLMVGSEGTLGVITAARLRLVPHLKERAVLLMGMGTTEEAAALTARLRLVLPSLSAAEIFYAEGLELVLRHAGLPAPLPKSWPVYLLVEAADRVSPLDELAAALSELDLAETATALADDPSGIQRLWAYRERHTEAVSAEGIPHKLDVTLPISRLAEFEEEVRRVVGRTVPRARVVLFGHVGDGNLHVNVLGPAPEDEGVDAAVFALVASMGGSISAEHGIGRAKTHFLALTRTPAELAAMRAVKKALDPEGLLNPGVLIP